MGRGAWRATVDEVLKSQTGLSDLISYIRQVALVVKNLPASAGDTGDAGSVLGREDPLEKEMATDSSVLAWRIPWTEEPIRGETIHGVAKSRTGHSNYADMHINLVLYGICSCSHGD